MVIRDLLERFSDLQLGDRKVTAWITWNLSYQAEGEWYTPETNMEPQTWWKWKMMFFPFRLPSRTLTYPTKTGSSENHHRLNSVVGRDIIWYYASFSGSISGWFSASPRTFSGDDTSSPTPHRAPPLSVIHPRWPVRWLFFGGWRALDIQKQWRRLWSFKTS